MKKVIIDGKQFEAEIVIKTDTDIIGYTRDVEVFAFRGITDFSQFQFPEGQAGSKHKANFVLGLISMVKALLDKLLMKVSITGHLRFGCKKGQDNSR